METDPVENEERRKPDSLFLEVRDLKTYFFMQQGIVRAVNGVDFNIYRGKTLGVVGESGCGKSVTARSILRTVAPPGRIVEGEIWLHRAQDDGGSPGKSTTTDVVDLAKLDPKGREIRKVRSGEISMIFQEPMTSLSPVHTIANQIVETITLHRDISKAEARRQAIEMLDLVNMPEPERTIDRYPHELSGGMRQRAMIAMALSCRPKLLIADEPTTALDVTTQAQILRLMIRLQDELGMAIMFITHDLGVIAQMADHVVVMYLGQIVESADVKTLFSEPLHPYTQALLRSVPKLGRKTVEKKTERLMAIEGSVPDPYSTPQACPFHPRCAHAIPGVCDLEDPPVIEASPGHSVRCVLYR
jgi:peptide/nickel transport system ATP-binding protein